MRTSANVPAAAQALQVAAVQLADRVWGELDLILLARLARLDRDRTRYVATAGVGAVLAVVMAIVALRPRRLAGGTPTVRAGEAEPVPAVAGTS